MSLTVSQGGLASLANTPSTLLHRPDPHPTRPLPLPCGMTQHPAPPTPPYISLTSQQPTPPTPHLPPHLSAPPSATGGVLQRSGRPRGADLSLVHSPATPQQRQRPERHGQDSHPAPGTSAGRWQLACRQAWFMVEALRLVFYAPLRHARGRAITACLLRPTTPC